MNIGWNLKLFKKIRGMYDRVIKWNLGKFFKI